MKPSDFIARPCPVPETLPDTEDFQFHCEHCEKTVTDLSYFTYDEQAWYRKQNPDACIRVRESRGVVNFFRPKKPIRLIVSMVAVIISSSVGYAELGSIVVSDSFQNATTLDSKASLAAEILARRADRLENLIDSLRPKPVVRKWNGGNDRVVTGVTF